VNDETAKIDAVSVLALSHDWLELRVTHMQYTNKRFRSGEPVLWDGKDSRDGKF